MNFFTKNPNLKKIFFGEGEGARVIKFICFWGGGGGGLSK